MLDAAQTALKLASDKSRTDLDEDIELTLALVKAIEIIGEAASKVSSETRAALPDIRWQDMIGMRRRLIHAYFDINLNIVWKTVSENLPALVRELTKMNP